MLKNVTARGLAEFVIAIILLGFFGIYEIAILFFKVQIDAALADVVKTFGIIVATYYLGSGSGSKNKDTIIASALPKQPENSK